VLTPARNSKRHIHLVSNRPGSALDLFETEALRGPLARKCWRKEIS
jgi:hypothetical protein